MTNVKKLTVRDIAITAMMVALIEVSKVALSFLPNIELTSFWLIMFTLFFGWKIVLVVPVFILIEGTMYGFGLWWFQYLYIWPVLVFLSWLFKKQKSPWFWAVLSGAFGLGFGALCAIPYIFIGTYQGNLATGFRTAFAWWVAGIPFDIIHCIGNFLLMLILYRPMNRLLAELK